MRLGASLMIPIDEYNRITLAADANKYLVPTVPKREGVRTIQNTKTIIASWYDDISGISGIFKSFSDAPGGFKEELEINYGLGAEYVYNDKFALHAGYHHESQSKGNHQVLHRGCRFQDECLLARCCLCGGYRQEQPTRPDPPLHPVVYMDGLKDLFKG